jgi:hypothetical protein
LITYFPFGTVVEEKFPAVFEGLRRMVFPDGSVSKIGTAGATLFPSVSVKTVPPTENIGWHEMQSRPGLCCEKASAVGRTRLMLRSNLEIVIMFDAYRVGAAPDLQDEEKLRPMQLGQPPG